MNKKVAFSLGVVVGSVGTLAFLVENVYSQMKQKDLSIPKIKWSIDYYKLLSEYVNEHPEILEDPRFEQIRYDSAFLGIQEEFKRE